METVGGEDKRIARHQRLPPRRSCRRTLERRHAARGAVACDPVVCLVEDACGRGRRHARRHVQCRLRDRLQRVPANEQRSKGHIVETHQALGGPSSSTWGEFIKYMVEIHQVHGGNSSRHFLARTIWRGPRRPTGGSSARRRAKALPGRERQRRKR